MSTKDEFVVALDQGTTSSRAIVYTRDGVEVSRASRLLPITFPHDAWVEQRAEDIWQTLEDSLHEAVSSIDCSQIRAIGLTNQRETTVAWERKSGKVLSPAIVWQCRRSAAICERLRLDGIEDIVKDRTGLVVDSYFSATKIAWMLENIPAVKTALDSERIAFGTVDSWVLHNLCKANEKGEMVFATEPSNACRTMLYSLKKRTWDSDLLDRFSLPVSALAEVKPSFGHFGDAVIEGNTIPVTGVLGDQQASLLGHSCLSEKSIKCTFGTGAFLLLNIGKTASRSNNGLLTSVAWSGKEVSYALEGSIFIAGSLIQWLRDQLHVLESASESELLASSVDDSAGLILIPSFVGLGAPYWKENVRGAMFGITRDTNKAHIARASLEGIAHQVADLLELPDFAGVELLNIDGGMVANSTFCQILSDLCDIKVVRSESEELTALGAARAAAFGAGLFSSLEDTCQYFAPQKHRKGGGNIQSNVFSPKLPANRRLSARQAWKRAVSALIGL